MIRLFVLTSTSIITVLTSSCLCCTSDSKTPKLPTLPKFKEIEAAPTGAPAPVYIERTK